MWRGWSVLVIGVLLACLPAPAAADPVERAKSVSRVDRIAAELRRDPVYVTDQNHLDQNPVNPRKTAIFLVDLL